MSVRVLHRGPHFIVIGAMKSATSTLHEQLALQPGLFMSTPKEPNFFSDDDRFRLGTDWYEDLYKDAAEGDIRGESSTHYTKLPDYPDTVTRMKALLPRVRLIYVMRHPVDRLVSHYIHQWSQNAIKCDINEALDRHPELVNYSRYGYQLAPYFDAYGQAAVLPVFLPALKRRPKYELQRIARFIGHSGEVVWKQDVESQNISSQRLRRFPGDRLIIDSPPMRFLRRTFVPQSVRDKVKARLILGRRPQLTRTNLARVESIFDEDLETLSSWLRIELACRNFDEKTAGKQKLDLKL